MEFHQTSLSMTPATEDPVERIKSLLVPAKLETLPQIAMQLAACDELLHSGFVDVSSLLHGLFEREDAGNILALLISACHSQTIAKWLLENWPTDYKELGLNTSYNALFLLSTTLISLMSTCHDISPKVMQNHHLVTTTPQILTELLSLNFTKTAPSTWADVENEDDNDEIIEFRVKRKSQKQAKRHGRRAAPSISLSPPAKQLLLDLGLQMPSCRTDAEDIAVKLVLRLRAALQELRLEQPSSEIKGLFIKSHVEITPVLAETKADLNNEVLKPAAFPQVQPLKAALYFDSVDGFGDWRIQIASRAEKHLREARRGDAEMFRVLVKKIKELSCGHFSDDNQKRLSGGSSNVVPVFEAKMTRDTRLVYQIDCVRDYGSECDVQVIKIFGVYTHAKLDRRLWDSMSVQLGQKGKEYRRRCTFRQRASLSDKSYVPGMFPPVQEISEIQEPFPEIPAEDLQEIHSLLVLEKFVSLSQALLNSILANVDVALPFDMTPQEREIVEHTSSCFVIGRSGTGKTTTMLFKMLGIEHAYELNRDAMNKPRQIFITQSKILASKVEEYFERLLGSLATVGKSREELRALGKQKVYGENQHHKDLVDEDEEFARSNDLPIRFSLLQDNHFPLFITYDQLCRLIEADMVLMACPQDKIHYNYVQSVITYESFLHSYWPHFPQNITKGLDPALVYSEFIGVIKGSEDTLTTSTGYLSADNYKSLSHRTQSTFSRQRDSIYDLFLAYTKQKSIRGNHGEYDSADRTYRILKARDQHGHRLLGKENIDCLLGHRVDFLYVDEAQDNLLIDALLLRSICKNPNGLFFAGDTAQTISVGSSFRFDDLKALLYRAEAQHVTASSLPSTPPRTFQLAVNYRSHGGIVNAAHSIIELITQFFPYSIDSLARETGVVAGVKPVFFYGFEDDTVRYEQFLFGDRGNPIEFGAQQCILVRDEASKTRLRQQVGEIGLILTLYESKGLEFNDVLLYNFFEDSPVELSSWRVVLNGIPQGSLASQDPAPTFSDIRHASISSELKMLYVAVTRARQNMWIVDCSDKGTPMRLLWTSREQVFCCTPNDNIPQLAVSSSAEEWENQGRQLFQHKRYYQALHCFERASLDKEVDVCRAYYLREEARKFSAYASDPVTVGHRRRAFVVAAKAFCRSADHPKEKRKPKLAYYRIAAECFKAGEELPQAAGMYVLAEEYTSATTLYRQLGDFDKAVKLVKAHRQHIDPDVATNVIDVSRLYYFTERNLPKANDLFETVEEELEYLQARDLDVAEADLLESLDKNEEAGRIHLAEGRSLEAARVFLKDKSDPQVVQLGVKCILQGLWECTAFGRTQHKDSPHLFTLLEMTKGVDVSRLSPQFQNELAMFQTFAHHPPGHRGLQRIAKTFLASGNRAAAFLCLDHHFTDPPDMTVASEEEAVETLECFYHYVRLLREVITHPAPHTGFKYEQLFGFRGATATHISLLPGTLLYDRFVTERISVGGEEELLVTEQAFLTELRQLLKSRLMQRISHEYDACLGAKPFNPCMHLLLNGDCSQGSACRRAHQTSYAMRVRLHLQQLLILHTLQSSLPWMQVKEKLSVWTHRLYNTLCPIHPTMGILHSTDLPAIPEYAAASNVLRDISRDIAYTTFPKEWPHTQNWFLSLLMKIAFFAFKFNAKEAAGYIMNAACLRPHSVRPKHLIRTGPVYVIEDLINSHDRSKDVSLARGALFLKHIIENRVPVEIGVLCDFIDQHVTLHCARQRFNQELPGFNQRLSLHSTVLPKSWFLDLLTSNNSESLSGLKSVMALPLRVVANFILDLARFLYSEDTEHLLFENRSLGPRFGVAHASFMLRLLRSLSYLGYNAQDKSTQECILSGFQSFKDGWDESPVQKTLKKYTQVQSWKDIQDLVFLMATDFPTDGSIRLHHVDVPRVKIEGVQTIVFSALEEVLSRLTQGPSALNPKAPAFNPRGLAALQMDRKKQLEEAKSLPTTANESIIHEKKVAAAKVIQKLFRKWRCKVKAQAEEGRPFHGYFNICSAKARTIEWPYGHHYRHLYQGPLPHVLATLDELSNQAHAFKSKIKKRLNNRKTNHTEFETLNKHLTFIVALLREIKAVQTILQPESDLHKRRDLEVLKTHVEKARELFYRTEEGWSHTICDTDILLGYKGIVVPPKPPKSRTNPIKPSLNVEDDLIDYQDFVETHSSRDYEGDY